jgi:hypothetical protein
VCRRRLAFRTPQSARILDVTAGGFPPVACSTAHLEVDVPLSEHEQRLLEQIERALVDDDPKFASTVRTGDRRQKARRKLQVGIVLVVVGLAVLIGGAVLPSVLLGVLGFLVMFGGAVLGILNYKAATGAVETGGVPGPAGRPGPARGKGTKARRQPLKNRLEERFRRRYDQ